MGSVDWVWSGLNLEDFPLFESRSIRIGVSLVIESVFKGKSLIFWSSWFGFFFELRRFGQNSNFSSFSRRQTSLKEFPSSDIPSQNCHFLEFRSETRPHSQKRQFKQFLFVLLCKRKWSVKPQGIPSLIYIIKFKFSQFVNFAISWDT